VVLAYPIIVYLGFLDGDERGKLREAVVAGGRRIGIGRGKAEVGV
jgi:hypothetical protein